eukprot:TRINITY_DN13954_c0_g1_i1.p1 TRINITY_DN13954_c0_g1~~TRINITY_DN13954_c0_g1_i1.p1  ORF type:complete len:105 (+),score=2.36 TRINITY_DN13954_c0_g1_i1:64-378(+)
MGGRRGHLWRPFIIRYKEEGIERMTILDPIGVFLRRIVAVPSGLTLLTHPVCLESDDTIGCWERMIGARPRMLNQFDPSPAYGLAVFDLFLLRFIPGIKFQTER